MYDPTQLEGKSHAELHARRDEIVHVIMALPGGHEEAPTILLQELAFICGVLRRKTSGPPKTMKPSRRGSKPVTSIDDILGMLPQTNEAAE